MLENLKKTQLSQETISAVFVIILMSGFLLSNLFSGFNFSIYVLVALISFAIVAYSPRSGIYAIVFLTMIFEKFFTLLPIYFRDAEYKLFLPDVIIIAIIFGLFLRKFFGKKIKYKFEKTDWLLLIFILIAFVYFLASFLISGSEFDLAFSSFKYYVFYPLLFFITAILFDSRQSIVRLLKFGFAGALVIIGFLFYGLVSGEGIWAEITWLSTEGSRILAARHAFYLAMALIVFLVYKLFNDKKISIKANLLVLIWLVGIIGALMRNIWIGLFGSIAMLYFILPKDLKKKLFGVLVKQGALLLTVILFIGYLSLIFPTSVLSQKTSGIFDSVVYRAKSFSETTEDQSVAWRYEVWSETLKDFRKSPVLGLGTGGKIGVEINEYNYRTFVEVRRVHNSIFALLVQLGVIPFALFFAVVYFLWKKLLKNKTDWLSLALAGLIVNYLIVSLFQPYLDSNPTAIPFWIMLGLVKAVSMAKNKTKILSLSE